MKKNSTIMIRAGYILLLLTCLLIAGITLFFNRSLFYIVLSIAVVVSVTAIGLLIWAGRDAYDMAKNVNHHLKSVAHTGVSFPMPVIVASENREIIWYNELFENSVVGGEEILGLSFDSISELPLDQFCTPSGVEVHYGGKSYITYGICDSANEKIYMLYFSETTALRNLADQYLLTRPAVLLILVDNYEELMQTAKESEKSQLLGQIDLLMEEFIAKTNGFIRKLERDRFVAVIEEQHLSRLVEERFSILDKARQLQGSGRYPVTLSIGIGRGGKDLAECEAWSKQAVEMALGRGGDQAAIKSDNGFEFYGGISKGIEKRTKVKSRIIASALAELVETSDHVILMGHRFGDLDSLGSAIALGMAIRQMGKHSVVCVDREKNLAKDLIQREEENGFLDFFLPEQDALELMTDRTLVIILDTHNPNIIESLEIYQNAKTVVVIDHHRKMVNHIDNAVIFYHEPFASSASEMVTELIQYLRDDIKLSKSQAEALLAGIMLDTKNFVLKTGVRTFEAAAFLRRMGADTVGVRQLFSSTMESYQQKTRLVSTAEIYKNCAIAISDFSSENLRIAAPQAADEMLGISGVEASFALYELGGCIHFSARSMGQINVQVIMEQLGGGGHLTMAGAQLKDTDMEKARQLLLEAIDRYREDYLK
ncbi:MAG: DHH family phosphoesterase [Oscillospiraceae bacterium]|nr:DHH family phosphoesterase [Oscillospiraceae bacterium]